jgi:hypothetical protein
VEVDKLVGSSMEVAMVAVEVGMDLVVKEEDTEVEVGIVMVAAKEEEDLGTAYEELVED